MIKRSRRDKHTRVARLHTVIKSQKENAGTKNNPPNTNLLPSGPRGNFCATQFLRCESAGENWRKLRQIADRDAAEPAPPSPPRSPQNTPPQNHTSRAEAVAGGQPLKQNT